MEAGTWRTRAFSVAPYLGVVLGWQLVLRGLGYGVANTGLYTDPVGQPLVFASALVERAPVLLASQLTLPFSDVAMALPAAWRLPLLIAMLGIVASFVWLFWSNLVRDRSQRWYALGALLAVVPACTTFTHGRMNLFVSIGAAALISRFAERAFDAATRSRFSRAIAALLIVRHTLLSAALLSVNAGSLKKFDQLSRASIGSLPNDPELATQTLIVVSTPHMFLSNFTITMRQHGDGYRGVWPAKIRTLGETLQAVEVRRIDLHTLEVEVADGYLERAALSHRVGPRGLAPVGFTLELEDSRSEVMEATADSRPKGASPSPATEFPRYRSRGSAIASCLSPHRRSGKRHASGDERDRCALSRLIHRFSFFSYGRFGRSDEEPFHAGR
jgi:hypothetical protein